MISAIMSGYVLTYPEISLRALADEGLNQILKRVIDFDVQPGHLASIVEVQRESGRLREIASGVSLA